MFPEMATLPEDRKNVSNDDDPGVLQRSQVPRNWQHYFKKDQPLWTRNFAASMHKGHPIWESYVRAASIHDSEVIGELNQAINSLLIFSTLFSVVVALFITHVEKDLNQFDPSSYTAKALEAIFTRQLNAILHILDPTLLEPTLDPFEGVDHFFPRIATSLLYASFDCALLVAGGAACMKQWIYEYQRASRLDRAPYNRAIHHQERYMAFRRWHVFEFGDLLGSIMVLDIVPFLVGCVYHLDWANTGTSLFWYIVSSGALTLYVAFLAFTTIVGICVPTSPFQSPISNLIRRAPQKIQLNLKRNKRAKLLMVLFFAGVTTAVSIVWILTTLYDLWLIFLWLGPMVFFIVVGLRQGLKMGRVSHFVPFMSIAIALLGVTSSAFVQLQPYMWSDFLHIGLPFIYLIPFILVIIGLSHRFSNAASQQRFPVNALLIAVIGLVVGQFVAWHFILQLEDLFDNGFEGFVQFSYWAIPLSSALVWASVMILGAASLFHEGEVEEDTREAEALGWLINHAYDDQTLHEALLCLPAIANTPLRRAALLRSSRDILTLLINTLVNEPAQRCLLERSGGGRGIELDYSFDEHREARLMFYLACLAEVSTESMGDESQLGHWRMRWDQLMGRLHGSWLYQNWYRALTISPQRIMQRELRFPRSWYSWFQSFQPDTLLLDLHTLSSHSDSYISTTAKAISSLLYPSTSPLENYSVWPIHCGNSVGNAEFFTYHRVLIEVRLVTMRFIQESRQKNDSKVSRRRHLFCYYDDLMNTWISGLASDGVMDIAQNGKFFEAAMVLGYLILEDHHDISRVLDSGESTPMKAARCLMALTRWLDRGTTDGQKISAMDTKLRDSFALSVISSTTRYLQLAAETVNPRKLGRFKRMEDDENTVFVGMKHLEVPLLKLAAQESHITFLRDQAISALEAFYAIPGHADVRLFPWELPSNLTSLIDQLKSRALTSDTTIKRVSALRAATKVLNLISEPLVARSLALDASPSLTEVIGCMVQDESVDIRIAALTAFLETPSLHPPISEPRETRVVGSDKPIQPSLSSDQVHIDVQYTPDTRLLTSYSNALKDHSSLLQALEDTRGSSSKEFIRKCVSFIDMLEKSLPREILPSPMIEMPKYPTALVLIASHEDEELVDASIRKLALELYARLCQSAEEKDLGRITKAVTWLIVHRVNMGLECISLLMDGLEQSTTYAELFGLAEVLKKAVVFADFGRGDLEEKCQELYDRLEEILHQEH